MSNNLRPVGEVTTDMEALLYELSVDHDLQHGEVLALVYAWLQIHVPEQREIYEQDGSSPVFCYGPKESA
jgi:hypothetical protein